MARPKKELKTENDVKAALKKMLDDLGTHHYPASAGAYCNAGVSDRIVCFRGRFVAVEAKRPGRRGEARGGLSIHQETFGENVVAAGGLFFKVDNYESIEEVRQALLSL
jgi:hypothetical protein